MQAEYGAMDGFDEPPHDFIRSLLSRDIIEKKLATVFFEGNLKRVELEYETLTEEQLENFFLKEFGGGTFRAARTYSFVLYGASGYTGSLCLEYILKTVKDIGTRVTFALAGRNEKSLRERWKEVTSRYPTQYEPGFITCDLKDPVKIREMVIQTRVVVNIAGPFMLTPADMLCEACIEYDTDYIDVNGEVPFTKKLIKYHEWAKANNVLVVPNAAGAGGVPDVGAFYTARELRNKHAGTEVPIDKMHMYLFGSSGGAPSGGTLATRAAMNAAMKDVAGIMSNPFALGGSIQGGRRPEDADRNLSQVEYDPVYDAWKAPFTYAFYETRLIRRSNWLLRDLGEKPYGRRLNYLEHLIMPSEQAAKDLQKSNTSSKAEEEQLRKEGRLFKKGDGLDEAARDSIWAEYWFDAVAEGGEKIRTRLSGKDGYDETAHMSIELALLCSEHRENLPFKGGVLTPGVAGGDKYIDALHATGLRFEVLADDAKVDFSKISKAMDTAQ
jgi:short subunit dehydrogenase-like uncharacterized protein